jgi:predicted DNA-binding protein (MmcQ/YjbR family)
VAHPVKPLRAADEKTLNRLRKLCLGHEGAVEKLSHGEPCFFVSPKKGCFAMFDNHHHGAEHLAVWLPTPAMEAQQALVTSASERFFVPPYLGYKGWVGVILDSKTDWAQLQALIGAAYGLIAAKARTPKK